MLPTKDHALTPLAVPTAAVSRPEPKNALANDKCIHHQRRKTLQTISELAPQHATTQGSTGFSSWVSNDVTIHGSSGNVGSRHSRNNRRRSLPTQGSTSQRDYEGIAASSISSSTLSTLHRSRTAPNDSLATLRHNARRRSMPPTFETRGRSLSPVAEGELSRIPSPDEVSQLSAPSRHRPAKAQSNRGSRGIEQSGGGWNARRRRELSEQEHAFMGADARRTRECPGLALGSPPALPSATRPTAEGDDPIARQSRHYPQLPSAYPPANTNMIRRDSRGRNGRHVNGSIVDGRLFQNTGARTANGTRPQPGLRRSTSATSDQQWTTRRGSARDLTGPAMRSMSSASFLSATMNEGQWVDPRSSSSIRTSSNSTGSSSTKSSISSNTTKATQRSPSFTNIKPSDHPLRQNPVTVRAESCPALTQASLDIHSPPALSHAFLGTQLVAQAAHPHGITASRQHSRSRSGSLPRTSSVHMQKMVDPNDIIYRENPDKRGLPGWQGGEVARRRSREEAERKVTRDKIKERVRRANELEDMKELELVEEGRKQQQQQQKKKKKQKRRFLCGLFGKA